jgi:hypothetical protein
LVKFALATACALGRHSGWSAGFMDAAPDDGFDGCSGDDGSGVGVADIPLSPSQEKRP